MISDTLQPRALAAPTFSSTRPIVLAAATAAAVTGTLLARDLQVGVAVMLGALFVPVALLSLPLAVCLWIPLAFLERLPALSYGPTLAVILVGVAWFGLLPVRRAVAEFTHRHQGMLLLLGGLLTWLTLSLLWAQDAAAAASDFWHWFVAAGVFIVVATSFSNRRYLPIACAAFVFGALASLAVGLVPGAIDRGTIAADEASRLGGSYGDPNFLAAGLVPGIALATGLVAVWRQAKARWLLGGAIGALAIGLAATGSRGALVAAVMAAVAALAFARGRRVQVGVLIATGVVIGGAWLATSSPDTLERLRGFDTGAGRIDLWTVAWRMTEDRPLQGVGVNNYRAESASYVRQPGQLEDVEVIVDRPHVVHNTYLQQLAETGVVGLILLLLLLITILRTTWAAASRFTGAGDLPMAALARAVFVAQLAILSASMFMSNAYDKRIWILLALGPALLAAAIREQSQSGAA